MESIFQKVGENKGLAERVEESILDAIRSKRLAPGDRLPTEHKLCEMFGVSRPTLREALRQISAKGLIHIRKGSGMYVAEYSSMAATDQLKLYLELQFDEQFNVHMVRIRRILEPESAKLAAMHRDDTELTHLEEILTDFEALTPGNYEEEGRLDRDFHLTIAHASHNPMMEVILDPLFQLMPRIRSEIYASIESAQSSAQVYHRKIYEAIRDQDSAKAFEMMHTHLHLAEEHSLMMQELSKNKSD